jgi:hypothetical protein
MVARPGAARRWAWFVGLWAAGVVVVGVVGLVVRGGVGGG